MNSDLLFCRRKFAELCCYMRFSICQVRNGLWKSYYPVGVMSQRLREGYGQSNQILLG